MTDPNFILLYVANPTASADFWARRLGRPPVEASPTFVMFALGSGVMLGLWGRDGVQPPATNAGGTELAVAVGDDAAVDTLHATWAADGVTIAQPPTDLDFGRAFLALDPDGHRIRVFAPRG
jgi:catechol 2,3-dioxygenase-like lactoylglutathione lyase family enzyme